MDPKTVSERLGHANTQKLFDTYAHVLPAMRQKAADRMGQFLGGSKVAVNEGSAVAETLSLQDFLAKPVVSDPDMTGLEAMSY